MKRRQAYKLLKAQLQGREVPPHRLQAAQRVARRDFRIGNWQRAGRLPYVASTIGMLCNVPADRAASANRALTAFSDALQTRVMPAMQQTTVAIREFGEALARIDIALLTDAGLDALAAETETPA